MKATRRDRVGERDRIGDARVARGRSTRFTAGVIATALMIAFVFSVSFVTPTFARMYTDFSVILPQLTAFVLKPWAPFALGAVPAAILAYVLAAPALSESRGSRLLALAFVLAALAGALCVHALYLPTFTMAARKAKGADWWHGFAVSGSAGMWSILGSPSPTTVPRSSSDACASVPRARLTPYGGASTAAVVLHRSFGLVALVGDRVPHPVDDEQSAFQSRGRPNVDRAVRRQAELAGPGTSVVDESRSFSDGGASNYPLQLTRFARS